MNNAVMKTQTINTALMKMAVIFPFIEYIFTYTKLNFLTISFAYVALMFVFGLMLFLKNGGAVRFIGWLPFCVCVAFNKFQGSLSTFYMLMYMSSLFFMYEVYELDENFVTYLIRAVSVIAFAVAVGCIFQKHFGAVYDRLARFFFNASGLKLVKQMASYGAYSGFEYQPTAAGAAISIGIVGVWANIGQKKIKKAIVLAIMYYALLLTAKRGFVLLSIIVPLLVYYLNASNNVIGKLGRAAGVVCVAVIVVFMYFYFSQSNNMLIFERLERFSAETNMNKLTSGRTLLAKNAVELFRKNPIFGIGMGAFSRLYGTSVHNVYMQLLVETGIVGFLAFVIPAVYVLGITVKAAKMQKAAETDRIAITYALGFQMLFLTYSFSGNPLYNTQWIYLYFMACALAIKVYEKRVNIQ